MKSARQEILSKIPPPQGGEAPAISLCFPSQARQELVARFLQEIQAVGARSFVAADALAARQYLERLVAQKDQEMPNGEVVVARRLVAASLGLDERRFHPLGSFPAQDAAISVTEADYALADTGTLVLFSAEGEGRTLSLLAPVNVTIVPASRIVSGLAELFTRAPDAAARSSAIVFITGPSRTGDIELTLTVGVHGPGELHAVVLADA